MYKKIIVLIMSLLFLTGCSLFNNKVELTHTIQFKDSNVIEYGSDINSSSFIIAVDDISVNQSNIEKNKLYISNFYVECPDIPKILGKHQLVYKIGKEEYTFDIEIKDTKVPIIQLNKRKYVIERGQELKLSDVAYKVKDNYSQEKNIKIELKKNGNNYQIIAIDENGNKSFADIQVDFKEIKKDENKKDNSTSSSNNSKDTSTTDNSLSTNKPSSSNKPATKLFTIDTYDDLETCEQECIAYIVSCKYSGSASAIPIKRDGIYYGYQAVFN